MNLEVDREFWRNQTLNLPVHVNREIFCERTSARMFNGMLLLS